MRGHSHVLLGVFVLRTNWLARIVPEPCVVLRRVILTGHVHLCSRVDGQAPIGREAKSGPAAQDRQELCGRLNDRIRIRYVVHI